MARTRLIKPSFFANDTLSEVSPLGRLLFIGLWTIADRDGRLEDRPRRIKAEILPFDNANADKLLADLETGGFIARYESGGKRLIQILTFARHQSPHPKEPTSLLPAMVESVTSQCLDTDNTVSSQAIAFSIIPSPIAVADIPGAAGAAAPPEVPPAEDPIGHLFRAWEEATGTTVTRQQAGSMDAWLEKLPEVAVLKAIAETGVNGARTWRYTETILSRYLRDGWADKPKGPKPEVFVFDNDRPLQGPEGMSLPAVERAT